MHLVEEDGKRRTEVEVINDEEDDNEVINDEEDDNQEGVLMDTPIGHETVRMDAPAAQLVRHDEGELFVMSLQR